MNIFCNTYVHIIRIKKSEKKKMPKLLSFEHKGDFPNLETFNIYKQQLPDCAKNVITVKLTSKKWEYNMESVQMQLVYVYEKLKPVVVRRTSNRNSKKQWYNNNLTYF